LDIENPKKKFPMGPTLARISRSALMTFVAASAILSAAPEGSYLCKYIFLLSPSAKTIPERAVSNSVPSPNSTLIWHLISAVDTYNGFLKAS